MSILLMESTFANLQIYLLEIEDEWYRNYYIKYIDPKEKVKLSVGFIPKLTASGTPWDPFTVVVKKIKLKGTRYHAILSDGKQVYSALLASQLNKLIKWGLLCSGRVIHVEHYAVSNIEISGIFKKVLILTEIKILLCK